MKDKTERKLEDAVAEAGLWLHTCKGAEPAAADFGNACGNLSAYRAHRAAKAETAIPVTEQDQSVKECRPPAEHEVDDSWHWLSAPWSCDGEPQPWCWDGNHRGWYQGVSDGIQSPEDMAKSQFVYHSIAKPSPVEPKPEPVEFDEGSHHLINGEFQSDKYPTTPRGKVPLSVKDATAQDLLWQYAQRRRVVDHHFADDLQSALIVAGYLPAPSAKPLPAAQPTDAEIHEFIRLQAGVPLPETILRALAKWPVRAQAVETITDRDAAKIWYDLGIRMVAATSEIGKFARALLDGRKAT